MKTFFRAQLQTDRLILIIVLALLLEGCRVTLVPDYDDSIAQEILKTAKRVDMFYLDILETTVNENGDRAYIKMVDSYVEIEVELASLLSKNKIRPLNENSIRICEITLELWVKYKEEHKEDNELSDGLIKLNRLTFSDLFYAMLVAEKAKEIISNPPK